jgi:intracellular sulfur oxidation DsrE/DsrF family protein
VSSPENSSPTARRAFLERAATGAAALAAVPFLARCADAAPVAAAAPADDEPWLKPLSGKHKQVFDAPKTNEGFPLMFAYAYLGTMTDTYKLKPGDVGAIVVARHFGTPIGLSDAIWAKYKLGKFAGVMDPATKKPAERNIYFNAKPGDMMMTDASAEKLIAKGVVIGVCNVALTVLSEELGKAIGVKKEDAYAEWKAGVIPGAFIVPSGVLAVARAQEHGCTYCFGG